MYSLIVKTIMRRALRRLNAGDIKPTLSAFAEDAVWRFPGHSSFGGEHEGRPAIERFLRRFVDAGIQIEVEEILVKGPPWNTRIAMRFVDGVTTTDGQRLYDNRGMVFTRMAWGKVHYQEDYLDTEESARFDHHLSAPS